MKSTAGTSFVILATLPFLFVVAPMIGLFSQGNWKTVTAALHSTSVQMAFTTSLSAALMTTVISLVTGLPCAFFLARWSSRWKRALDVLLLLPIVLPPLVGGMAELTVFGPLTVLGEWFSAKGINLTDSWLGVVLAQSFVTAPFLILAAKAGFEDIAPELPEAASLSGAGWWTQLCQLYIPIAVKSVLAGVLLTFTRAFGEFGATMMMAYHPTTVPVELYVQFSAGGLSSLLPIAVLVVLVAVVIAVVSAFLSSPQRTRS